MISIRRGRPEDHATILAIINAAAQAYRGVIPADRWHDPYMSATELEAEVQAGVVFWLYEADGQVLGVMGSQPVGDVDLIRHAYVVPGNQRSGIGSALLAHLRTLLTRRILIGTWSDAEWAIRFYRRHGFELVPQQLIPSVLRRYWNIPDRQIDTSVVLASPPYSA